jgi:hypothetical protein
VKRRMTYYGMNGMMWKMPKEQNLVRLQVSRQSRRELVQMLSCSKR